MPPASPVPGWSRGDVWTEIVATRRGNGRPTPGSRTTLAAATAPPLRIGGPSESAILPEPLRCPRLITTETARQSREAVDEPTRRRGHRREQRNRRGNCTQACDRGFRGCLCG